MIKTSEEIEGDFYMMLRNDALSSAVNGDVYRFMMRPPHSQQEDIVVKFLSGRDEQLQNGVVIVNIYVPDITLPDGRNVADHDRIAVLQRAAIDMIDNSRQGDYRLRMDNSMTVIDAPDINQHYINCRIRFDRYSD